MAENNFDNREQEKQSRFKFILLRGLEDLPDKNSKWYRTLGIDVSGSIAKSLGAESFDSNWTQSESLEEKLTRLDVEVQKAKDVGQEVMFIGVSAGGGLAEAYILRHPGSITHVFSLLGVLHPDINDPKIIRLNGLSDSFKEMTTELSQKLTPKYSGLSSGRPDKCLQFLWRQNCSV